MIHRIRKVSLTGAQPRRSELPCEPQVTASNIRNLQPERTIGRTCSGNPCMPDVPTARTARATPARDRSNAASQRPPGRSQSQAHTLHPLHGPLWSESPLDRSTRPARTLADRSSRQRSLMSNDQPQMISTFHADVSRGGNLAAPEMIVERWAVRSGPAIVEFEQSAFPSSRFVGPSGRRCKRSRRRLRSLDGDGERSLCHGCARAGRAQGAACATGLVAGAYAVVAQLCRTPGTLTSPLLCRLRVSYRHHVPVRCAESSPCATPGIAVCAGRWAVPGRAGGGGRRRAQLRCRCA